MASAVVCKAAAACSLLLLPLRAGAGLGGIEAGRIRVMGGPVWPVSSSAAAANKRLRHRLLL